MGKRRSVLLDTDGEIRKQPRGCNREEWVNRQRYPALFDFIFATPSTKNARLSHP
jgi:hypothetical protein